MNNEFILTSENIEMLKHLNSTVNQSIIFRDNTDTVQMKDVEARKLARVSFGIPPKTFGVKLSTLISVLKMLDTDKIYLEDESIRITGKNGTVFHEYLDIDLIQCCPSKNYDLGENICSFTLSNEMLNQIQTFGKTLGADMVKFFVEDGTFYAETYNHGNQNSNSYKVEICPAEDMDEDIKIEIFLKYFNLLDGIYTVEYKQTHYTTFTSDKIQYYIATQIDSDR